MIHHSFRDVMLLNLNNLKDKLEKLASDYSEVPMMCRTHGQSATPSTMGKEIANFAYRLKL